MLTDLFDKEIQEGDKVYVARQWSRSDARLYYAEVTRLANTRVNLWQLDEAGNRLEPEYRASTYDGRQFKTFNPEFYVNYTRSNKFVIVSRKGDIYE